jgi:hypothetical protein
LPSPTEWRGEKKKDLTAPLTFILSRRGREGMEGKILKAPPSPLPSPAGEEGRKREDERKNFKIPLTLPSPAKWRGRKSKIF